MNGAVINYLWMHSMKHYLMPTFSSKSCMPEEMNMNHTERKSCWEFEEYILQMMILESIWVLWFLSFCKFNVLFLHLNDVSCNTTWKVTCPFGPLTICSRLSASPNIARKSWVWCGNDGLSLLILLLVYLLFVEFEFHLWHSSVFGTFIFLACSGWCWPH